MKRLKENGTWTLFSPHEVPDLHDLYGKAFEKRYAEYEKMKKDAGINRNIVRIYSGEQVTAIPAR